MKIKQKARQNPRVAALLALAEVLDEHQSLAQSSALSAVRDSRDSALARHLAYGVLRWLTALEWLAAQLLARPLKNRDRDVQRLILLGLQQLWHDQTASHAAINETAECARLLGKPWAVGLVNAVLRRFQREQQALLASLERHDERFAHPRWLLDEIKRDWPDQWEDIVAANNQQAPLWLRINRQQAVEAVLRKQLQDGGFETSDHPYAPDALCINPAAAVAGIPGFESGWISVQDPAAQLAVDLLDPGASERILDACAAPGGKAAHLLERNPAIELTILDKRSSRVEQIHQNLQRLGLQRGGASVDIHVGDATTPGAWWTGKKFHKILLDAPCSATGVIRRHPEIKWLRSSAQVDAVAESQAALLAAMWPLLESGGVLVYATCSILKRENDLPVQRFLEQHEDAESVVIAADWGAALTCGRQILPGEAQMDGFFYAVLRKTD